MKQIEDKLKESKDRYEWTGIELKSSNRDIRNPFKIIVNKEELGIQIIRDILFSIRQKIDDNFNLLKHKDLSKNKIRIGTGTSDVILNIFYKKNKSRESNIIIELDFADRTDIWLHFKKGILNMCKFIEYDVCVTGDKLKIMSQVKISSNNKNTVDLVVSIVRKYLLYTSEMYKNIEL